MMEGIAMATRTAMTTTTTSNSSMLKPLHATRLAEAGEKRWVRDIRHPSSSSYYYPSGTKKNTGRRYGFWSAVVHLLILLTRTVTSYLRPRTVTLGFISNSFLLCSRKLMALDSDGAEPGESGCG